MGRFMDFALAFFTYGAIRSFLDAAKNGRLIIFLANVAMDRVCVPGGFSGRRRKPVYWDTTATACAACGLLQIAENGAGV